MATAPNRPNVARVRTFKQPRSPGVFCMSTSYRQEQNIVEGRHDTIFPMFEFEMPGDMNDLEQMEKELCEHMGFGSKHSVVGKDYSEWCDHFAVEELTHEHENLMSANWQGRVCMIKTFQSYITFLEYENRTAMELLPR